MATVIAQSPATEVGRGSLPYMRWTPIVAGAFAAAAFGLVLDVFGVAVGLAVTSTAPTWRDSSAGLWILSGVYLIVVALASYGLGGYISGRMRDRLIEGSEVDRETRDGIHGIVVWAVATLLTAALLGIVASPATRTAVPAAGAAASVAGENLIAFDLDKLLRGVRPASDGTIDYARSEAARILLTSAGHEGVGSDDRAYLIRRVAEVTDLPPADAQKRVDATIESAHQNIERARHAAVVLAFCVGAATLVGAVAASVAAVIGGKHRDIGGRPMWG